MRAFEFETYDAMLDGLSFMADSCSHAAANYAGSNIRKATLWAEAERAINTAIQIATIAKDRFGDTDKGGSLPRRRGAR